MQPVTMNLRFIAAAWHVQPERANEFRSVETNMCRLSAEFQRP